MSKDIILLMITLVFFSAVLIQSRWRYHKYRRNPDETPVWALTPASRQRKPRSKLLNGNEKHCLIFILKLKYFVSRRHFQQTLRPYDVKDVLEQYSTGHMEMLLRIKHINHKITSIESMAHSGLRGQHESKSLINYRLMKLEEFMRESDSKLDQLLRLQNENKVLYESILQLFESNPERRRSSETMAWNVILFFSLYYKNVFFLFNCFYFHFICWE